jgi:plastocyanin
MRRTVTFSLALLPCILVLGWAAAGVALAGGGCHGGEGAIPSEGTATVVKIDGCTFAPTVTRVPIGAEVQFLNTSLTSHDVTGRAGSWGSGNMPSGAAFAARFAVAGVYAYSCSLHPGMAGVVIAGGPDAVLEDNVNAAPIAVPPALTTPEPAAMTAPAPATPPAADLTLPLIGVGGLGLIAGFGIGAVAARRRADVA